MNPERKWGCLPVFATLFLGLSSALLQGCGAPEATQENAPDAAGRTTTLGQTLTKGEDITTDSNINQINQILGMVKMDSGAPATLEEAKRAAKEIPAEMWIDKATGKPLVYDPATGTVSRAK